MGREAEIHDVRWECACESGYDVLEADVQAPNIAFA